MDDRGGFSTWLVHAIPFVFASMLSAAGGAVRYLNNVSKGSVSFKLATFCIEIFTSGFVGIVAYMLCDYAALSWDATAAVVAISGHMGVRALSIAEDITVSALKAYMKGKQGGKEE